MKKVTLITVLEKVRFMSRLGYKLYLEKETSNSFELSFTIDEDKERPDFLKTMSVDNFHKLMNDVEGYRYFTTDLNTIWLNIDKAVM